MMKTAVRQDVKLHRIKYHNEPQFRTPTSVIFEQTSFEWPGKDLGNDSDVRRVRRSYELVPKTVTKLVEVYGKEVDRLLATSWPDKKFKPIDLYKMLPCLESHSHYRYEPGELIVRFSTKELQARYLDGTLITVKGIRGLSRPHFIASAMDRLLYAMDNASHWLYNTAEKDHYTCHEQDRCDCKSRSWKDRSCTAKFGTPIFYANNIYARQSEYLKRTGERDRDFEFWGSQLRQYELLTGES